jgi:chromosome segregation ATPase
VALRRRQEVLSAFRWKLETLERLLADDNLSRYPARASISAFASWEDADFRVAALSRAALYSNDAEYPELRRRMEQLLSRVTQRRAKGTRKQNLLGALRQQLIVAEERAESYANQYSTARAELLAVRAENARLQEKLKRLSPTTGRNVVSLHVVRPKSPQSAPEDDK